MKMSTKSKLLLSAVSFSLMMASAAPTYAQDDIEGDEDTIVITGSRIQNVNVVSSSPVVTVDAELFDVRGTVDTVDLVNTLPAVYPAQTTAFANGATGTSTLDLRNLGATRTLVLVDGKRLAPGGPLGGFAADLNLIAPQLVERVEVVTGGASAIYGSDAVAGVANFITRKDFEGIEVDLQYGFNQSNNGSDFFQERLEAVGADPANGSVTDNETFQASILLGTSLDDGRGNVTGYFNYAKNDGIQQGDRDFSQCATFPTGDDDLICLGSNQGPFPTTFVLSADPANPIGLVDAAGNPLLNADGTPQTSGAFSLGTDDSLTAGFNNAFNFNPFNPIRREVERFNAGFSGYYDITNKATGYLDFGFTSSSSPQIIAPSAAFGSTINQVNCDNPVLTDEARALICGSADINGPFPRAVLTTDLQGNTVDAGLYAQSQVRRRFVEGGPRTDDRQRNNFRLVGGVRGTLDDENLNYDVFGQYSETRLQRIQFNQVTLANLQQSLDIITDPVTGLPVCRDSSGGCVPFTSAYQIGVPSSDALRAFVDTPTLTVGTSRQTVFGATIGGDLGKYGFTSPYAEESMSLLVGTEYRKDELIEQADGIASSGNLVGSGGATVPADGETSVFEVFAEAQLPLIAGVTGIEQFNLNGAIRYSDYASQNNIDNTRGEDFSATTYAVGASWVPVDDLRIRAQYQRAIRAPNILNLFSPQNSGLTNLTDPCAGATPGNVGGAPVTAAQCANTGLPANLFGLVAPDSGQLNTLTGGNPGLTPETADTYTLGVVYQPSAVSGLTLSADYFDITVSDAISTIPTATTLNQCLLTGATEFCSLIQRGPDGSLTFFPRDQAFITATAQNIAEFATSGIDFQVLYGFDIGSFGELSFNYNSTYVISQEQTNLPGTPSFDCVGFFAGSCGNPNFEYRHNMVTTWQSPWKVRASAVWRYSSGVDQVGSIDNGFGEDGTVRSLVDDGGNAIDESIDATGYLDLAAFYDVNDSVTLRVGANNVLDNDPPIVTTFGTTGVNVEANTVAGVYDAGGRFLFAGVNMKF
ncbi:MAG: TonB-dependent receptor [Litorimonas sp.]